MLRLPMPADGYPSQTAQVLIEDAYYAVIWRWNERDGAWYFGLADADGERIVSGVRVVLGVNLLSAVPAGKGPDGAIVVMESGGTTAEPGLRDLGNRVQAIYVSRVEFTEAA